MPAMRRTRPLPVGDAKSKVPWLGGLAITKVISPVPGTAMPWTRKRFEALARCGERPMGAWGKEIRKESSAANAAFIVGENGLYAIAGLGNLDVARRIPAQGMGAILKAHDDIRGSGLHGNRIG